MGLRILLHAALTGCVFAAPYYWLTKRYSKTYSFPDRLLGAFAFGTGQIVLTGIILGFLQQFKSLPLLILNLALSAAFFAAGGLSRAELARQGKEAAEALRRLLRILREGKVLAFFFILAAVQTAWWSFHVWLFPPYAWDSLTYHLPKVAFMLQSGGIRIFPTDRIFVNTYPFNGEILYAWNTIFLRNDLLADGTQIGFSLAAAIALFSIGRKLGLRLPAALYAVAFLLVPIVIQQADVPYCDLIVCALFLMAVNFALIRDPSPVQAVLLGLLVGLNIGVKYLFVVAAFIPAAAYFLMTYTRAGHSRDSSSEKVRFFRRAAMKGLILFLIPVLLLGGVWYIRNLALFGNPMAPVKLVLFGRTILPGLFDGAELAGYGPRLFDPPAVLKSWLEISAPYWDHPIYNFDAGRGGFGPVFPIVLLPSLVFALGAALRKRERPFLFVSGIFALAFLAVPVDWLSRFTLFACGWGILAFAFVLENGPRSRLIERFALPVFLLTWVLGNVHMYYTPDRILDFLRRPLAERRSVDLPVFFEPYQGLFRALAQRPGTAVAYTDVPDDISYPLWNADFSNSVVAIPRRYAERDELARTLLTLRPSQIVTTTESDVMAYALENPGEFKVDYSSGSWRVLTYLEGFHGR